MRCPTETREIDELLAAWGSGRLEAKRALEWEEHRAGCAACRREAGAQAAVWKALDAWEAPAVSAGFDRRLAARMEGEHSWVDRLFRSVKLIPVAATAAVVILAGLLIPRPGDLPSPATAQVEAVGAGEADRVLEDMEAIREFSGMLRAEPAAPRM